MKLLTVALRAVMGVPPKVITLGLAVPEATPPPIAIIPVPLQVDAVLPRGSITRITRSKVKYHAVIAIVTVPWVKLTPRVVPGDVVPMPGVIIPVQPVKE